MQAFVIWIAHEGHCHCYTDHPFLVLSLLFRQDKESITNADRRRAVDAASLHGKHNTQTPWLF